MLHPPERRLQLLLAGHAILSAVLACLYLAGGDTGVLGALPNSFAKDALFVALSALGAADVRRRGWFALLIALAYAALVAGQVATLLWGGAPDADVLGLHVSATVALLAWMTVDVVLAAWFVAWWAAAARARDGLRFLHPAGFAALEALADVTIEGDRELLSPPRSPATSTATSRTSTRAARAGSSSRCSPSPRGRCSRSDRRSPRSTTPRAAPSSSAASTRWRAGGCRARCCRCSRPPCGRRRRCPTSATTATAARGRRSATRRMRAAPARRPRRRPCRRGSRRCRGRRPRATTSSSSAPARPARSSPPASPPPAGACSCSSAARTSTRPTSPTTRCASTSSSTTRARSSWRRTSACRCCRGCASAAGRRSTTGSAWTRRPPCSTRGPGPGSTPAGCAPRSRASAPTSASSRSAPTAPPRPRAGSPRRCRTPACPGASS